MEQPLYELPEGWEWKGLLETVSTSGFKVGKIPKKDFQMEGSLPIIDQSQSYIAGYCESDDGYRGELPVIVYGDHTNSVKHINFEFICGADGTKVLAPIAGVDSWWLYYAILQFRPESQGYRRHFPILKQRHIPLPPLNEQKRIVAKLDALFTRIDAAITHLQETLELSKALFASALDETFGWSGRNKKLPEGWRWGVLGDVCNLLNGYAFKSKDYIESSNTMVVRMGNIRPNGLFDIEHNVKYLPDSFAEDHSDYILNDGDLVIAMTDMASKMKILGIPTLVSGSGKRRLLLNQRVGKLYGYDFEKINVMYLKLVLSSNRVRDYFKGLGGGGLQINIGKKQILSVDIPIPPLEEQQRIVTHLNALAEHTHTLEAETQDRLDQLTALKSSLLDSAFRGQL